jgi:hypothetical protein
MTKMGIRLWPFKVSWTGFSAGSEGRETGTTSATRVGQASEDARVYGHVTSIQDGRLIIEFYHPYDHVIDGQVVMGVRGMPLTSYKGVEVGVPCAAVEAYAGLRYRAALARKTAAGKGEPAARTASTVESVMEKRMEGVDLAALAERESQGVAVNVDGKGAKKK